VLVRVGLRPVREYEGEIFTDYYFGEANTANKLDNQHNNAINENLNWGGFPGCYSSLPPTEDLVPRSRTIPGGKGEKGGSERRRRTQHHQQGTRLHVDDELLSRRFRRETTTSKDEVIETSRGGMTIQTDDQLEVSSLQV